MIKINLLPAGREVKKVETMRQQMAVAIGAVVLTLFLCGYLNLRVRGEIKDTQQKINETRNEIKRLEEIIKEVKDIEAKRDEVEAKLKVIDNLEKGRVASVMILDAISKAVPEKLWLTSYTESQGSIRLNGIALNNPIIAEFIQNLEKSDIFKNVNFGSSKQVVKDKYNLVEFDLSLRADIPGMKAPEPVTKAKTSKGKERGRK